VHSHHNVPPLSFSLFYKSAFLLQVIDRVTGEIRIGTSDAIKRRVMVAQALYALGIASRNLFLPFLQITAG
jgi:hypothetical protein